MQKVLDLLEKHVQWLALGLGLLWLLFMTYSYVIKPPAVVDMGGKQLTAGEVDDYTVENSVKQLEVAMQPQDPPEMVVQNFAAAWLNRMNWGNVEPILAQRLVTPPPPYDPEVFRQGPSGPLPGAGPQQPQQVIAQATALPKPLPRPTPADFRFGRSTVIQPPPPQVPGAPVPAVPAALPQEQDRDWVTHSFKISIPDLAALFKKFNVPPPAFKTSFLRLEMVRQELLPNGQWGNETLIKPLNNGVLRQPWPGEKATRGVEMAYFNWAQANGGDILQPAFYQTVQAKGTMWTRPGPKGEQAVAPQTWVLGQYKGNLNDLTPEQRKMELDARRAAAKQRNAQPRQPRTPRGRGVPEEGMMDDPSMQAPRDAERPQFHQVAPRRYPPGAYPPGMDPSMMDPSMMEDPSMMGDMGYAPPPAAGVGVPNVDYPAGEFDPSAWGVLPPGSPAGAVPPQTPEIEVWQHDETVKPGATYRYKLRYFIKNPFYQQPALVKKPQDAQLFTLVSEYSDWGPNVEVPPLTNFFIAGGGLQRDRVRMEIFTWKGGVQHTMTQVVAPGDVIGKPSDTADFTTGYTVVDIRLDAKTRDPIIYLTDAKGSTVVRDPKVDRNSALLKKLQEEVKAAQPPVAAAAR